VLRIRTWFNADTIPAFWVNADPVPDPEILMTKNLFKKLQLYFFLSTIAINLLIPPPQEHSSYSR
jgi:hypothetical protein